MKLPAWTLILLPTLILYIGVSLNKVVMAVNHGKMPVMLEPCDEKMFAEEEPFVTHRCMTRDTHLNFLGDWIVLRNVGIESLGDVLMDVGALGLSPCFWIWIGFVLDDKGYFRRA
jgi:Family of unknown function (DUF5317)